MDRRASSAVYLNPSLLPTISCQSELGAEREAQRERERGQMETSSGKTSEYSSKIVEEGKVKYLLSSVPRGCHSLQWGDMRMHTRGSNNRYRWICEDSAEREKGALVLDGFCRVRPIDLRGRLTRYARGGTAA